MCDITLFCKIIFVFDNILTKKAQYLKLWFLDRIGILIMTKKQLHILSNTHWDREHRHDFQETNMMLVELFDKLIEIMESDADFKHYTLDGQSVMVDDYLTIKPYMKDRLGKLIKQGRILIGPWYTLLDAFGANPEAIVRNLLVGDRFCRQFGEPMKFGYSIFSFGQIAQLPQIYAGFGIENIIFYKGYSDKLFKKPEFIWIAPDGTKALTSKLSKFHRVNAFVNFTVPVILGGDMLKPGWKVSFDNGNKVCHCIDSQLLEHHAKELEPDIRIREEEIVKAVNNLLDEVSVSSCGSVFAGFEGIDFSLPVKEIPEAIEKANKLMGDKVELIHSCITNYIDEFRKHTDLNSLLEYQGELRFGPVWKVHSDSMSANIEIKQNLAQAEYGIINYAEPFSVIAGINAGMDYPQDLLLTAWKLLMQAHCHDSLHGLGVPKIKADVLYRIAQAKEIAEGLTRRAIEQTVAAIDTSQMKEDESYILLYNPTAYTRNDIVELTIDLPRENNVEKYWFQELNGDKLSHYENSRYEKNIAAVNFENRPKSLYCDRREVSVNVKDIPALGYKCIKLCSVKSDSGAMPFPPPKFPYNPIAKSADVLDNGLVEVKIEPNGSVNITDKQTGHKIQGANIFQDSGCAGDMWVHRQPEKINTISSIGCSASISIIKNSYLTATSRVEISMNIPVSLTQDRKQRSQEKKTVNIITEITLKKDSKTVEFKTFMENTCKDHKFTVCMPTNIKTKYSNSECPFEIRAKLIDSTSDNDGVCGDELLHHSMRQFVDISDDKNGIALFSKGLMEFETLNDNSDNAVIKLTLLRAVTQTFPIHEDVFLNYENEPSQCLGSQIFEYALYLHKGNYNSGDVISESRKYNLPLSACQFGKGKKGDKPAIFSFMSLNNSSTVLSCLKKAENDNMVIIRLNNPTDAVINEKIKFGIKFSKAYLLNLNEDRIAEINSNSTELDIKIEPYKIITIGIEV